ncbi:MAG: hypothetical protein ACLFQL_01495, partial [Paracoccaceae bacterium]
EASETVRSSAPLGRAIPGDAAQGDTDEATAEPGSIEEIAAAALRPEQTEESGATDTPDLSDENDFEAVSERRDIESDAERLARAQAQYQVIEPAPLPPRTAEGSPNIVRYALQTSNPVGQQIYRRPGFNKAERQRRACAQFASSDLAQREFLRRGGPERDRLGLDPDGDGYACDWDPAPFRRAVQG